MRAESQPVAHSDERVHALVRSILLGEGVHWPEGSNDLLSESFVSYVEYHGVCALVSDQLHSGTSHVPDAVRDTLSQKTMQYAAVEMARSHDLRKLHSVLNEAGIPALLLKGASLAYTHYQKPYFRLGVDTDILIGIDAIERARKVFVALDFRATGMVYKSHQFTFVREGPGGVTLAYDVHWRASNLARFARVLSFENAWKDSIGIPGLAGWRTLGPVQALMLACMHRAANPNHDPNRLIWLYDLKLLFEGLSKHQLEQFVSESTSARIGLVCLEGLAASAEQFAMKIPPEVIDALSGESRLRIDSQKYDDSQLALIMDDLKRLPDLRSRVGLLRELFLPPGDYLLATYEKQSRGWIPWLYLRYLFGGLTRRLTLH